MITEALKARAIAKLKREIAPIEIAEELELPVAVINEWKKALSPTDLAHLSSRLEVIDELKNGELLDAEVTTEVLDVAMRDTAMKINNLILAVAIDGDLVKMQSLKVATDVLANLHRTFVNPLNIPQNPPGAGFLESLLTE